MTDSLSPSDLMLQDDLEFEAKVEEGGHNASIIANGSHLNGGGGGASEAIGLSVVATGIGLYTFSFLTVFGNAMVLHAIRTEKRLQTVGERGGCQMYTGRIGTFVAAFGRRICPSSIVCACVLGLVK